MKRRGLLVALLACSALAFSQVIDRPLATLRLTTTAVITQRQVQAKIDILEKELGVELSAAQKTALLNAEIDTELIMQAAARAGVTVTENELTAAVNQQKQSVGRNLTDAQFQQAIVQSGLSWEEFRSRLRRKLIQEKYIANENRTLLTAAYTPTEAEIQAVYEQNASEFLAPAYVRFTQIFVDTRNLSAQEKNQQFQKIRDMLTRVRSGGVAAFDALVQASIDDPTYSGGDFGFLPRGEQTTTQLLGQPFIDAVFALADGAISDVLESRLGYHIVRITNKRPPKLLTLSDPVAPGGNLTVRQQIQQYLLLQKQQERMKDAVSATSERLRAEAEVQVFTQNIPW